MSEHKQLSKHLKLASKEHQMSVARGRSHQKVIEEKTLLVSIETWHFKEKLEKMQMFKSLYLN